MDTGTAAADPIRSRPEVRRGVSWAEYCRLRDDPANGRVRMDYLDGTLTMSPLLRHDRGSRRIYDIVTEVAITWDIPFLVIGTTTLRREGPGPFDAVGKEPDEGFYLGPAEAIVRDNDDLDLAVDPPPSLAIEVDHTGESGSALPLYARLGVAEVWIFRARDASIRFLGLVGDHYEEVDRSLGLPMLTPALVLEALEARRGGGMGDNQWRRWLATWARDLPAPP